MAKRKFQIDQLIINSPYEEPSEHWHYVREVKMFERRTGRRKAGYVVATPGSKFHDDPGVFVELPLVNQIRPRVQAGARPGIRVSQGSPSDCWNTGKTRKSGAIGGSSFASSKRSRR